MTRPGRHARRGASTKAPATPQRACSKQLSGALSCALVLLAVAGGSSALAAEPGVKTPPAPATTASTASTGAGGTTIISGNESPIGLYITPWKNAFTEQGLYAPREHRLQILPEAIDPDTFRRQNIYYDTITAFRAKQRGRSHDTPTTPAPKAPR